LRRLRWQIELLFRLWKDEGQVDQTRGRKPERVLCELLAKLLGQVVQHWATLLAGSPLEVSGVKAARRGRRRGGPRAARPTAGGPAGGEPDGAGGAGDHSGAVTGAAAAVRPQAGPAGPADDAGDSPSAWVVRLGHAPCSRRRRGRPVGEPRERLGPPRRESRS